MSSFYHSGPLPPDSQMYFGREKELDQLIEEITSQHPRYIIIYSGPGMGKTSLIRRLRQRLSPQMQLHQLYFGSWAARHPQSTESFYSYLAKELIRRENAQSKLTANFNRQQEVDSMAPSSSQAERSKVFISYSHTDVRFLRQLQTHLKPYQQEALMDYWDDTRIAAGADWREEIRQAITTAKVAVLLLSSDFLASDFIAENELPPLLAAAKEQGVTILPVLVQPCAYNVMGLSKFQAVRVPDIPFKSVSEMSAPQRNKLWMQVTKDIIRALNTPSPPSPALVPPGSAEAGNVSMTTVDVRNELDFQDLLRNLYPSSMTIVALDQLGDVNEEILASLANTLRDTSESRYENGNQAFKQFSFILTGGSELFKLAGGSTLSPLKEIVLEIDLKELSREECGELVHCGLSQAGFPDAHIAVLCEAIYEQFHGHPYFTQYLGGEAVQSFLQEHTLPEAYFVARQAAIILNNDTRFTTLFNKAQRAGLLDTLQKILTDSRQVQFHLGNPKVALLYTMGFIHENAGYCIICNRAYTHKLKQEFGLLPATQPVPKPKYSPETPPTPPRRLPFRLELTQQENGQFHVRAVDQYGAVSPEFTSRLPYTQSELIAVFKALLPPFLDKHPFIEGQDDDLARLGLWHSYENRPIVDALENVGQTLYQTLMTQEIGNMFEKTLNAAINQGASITLQLRIDHNAVELARYPWELLYHRYFNSLLLSKNAELIRYIMYSIDKREFLPIEPPLRILYICPRPTDISGLPEEEQQQIQRVLLEAKEKYKLDIEIDTLNPPTFTKLLDYLDDHPVHVLHFDGHGNFGRLCNKCHTVNHTRFKLCQHIFSSGQQCKQNISDVEPTGYLFFEKVYREKDLIDIETFSNLMSKKDIRLAVLSACDSAAIDGGTLFAGTAQALIKKGVMAVVATQLPISPEGARNFATAFYRALISTNSIVTAVNSARQNLMYPLSDHEWFILTLYTNIDDHELRMFSEK